MQLFERAEFRAGYRVEAVYCSAPSIREDIASRMLRHFQVGTIAIPNDPALIADLHSVEKTITASGHMRYNAPRSDIGHADRFFALGIALHVADDQTFGPIEGYTPAYKPRFSRATVLSTAARRALTY